MPRGLTVRTPTLEIGYESYGEASGFPIVLLHGFLDAAAPRMAQQAAIAQDLLDFMEALGLDRVGLAGYDWGGRAACITAILAPERVQALVTIGGYNVQNTLVAQPPASARQERALWYQWYFNTE